MALIEGQCGIHMFRTEAEAQAPCAVCAHMLSEARTGVAAPSKFAQSDKPGHNKHKNKREASPHQKAWFSSVGAEAGRRKKDREGKP